MGLEVDGFGGMRGQAWRDDPLALFDRGGAAAERRWWSTLELREVLAVTQDDEIPWQVYALVLLMAVRREVARGEWTDRCQGDGWVSATTGIFAELAEAEPGHQAESHRPTRISRARRGPTRPEPQPAAAPHHT